MIPVWFWNSLMGSGPFTLHKNESAARNKGGAVMPPMHAPNHIQLPCCESCNGILNDRFERTGTGYRPAVERGFDGQHLTAEEARSAALWILKTCLLMVNSSPKSGWNIESIAWEPNATERKLYEWMITDTDPPSDVSLFIHRFSPQRSQTSAETMTLPVLHADGTEVVCQGATVGLLEWGFTLVHHPGWDFLHPSAADHSVVRLWPAHGEIELSKLAGRADWPVAFHKKHIFIEDGSLGAATLPQLAVDTRFEEIPGFRGATG